MKSNKIASGYKMILRWSWREIWSGQLWSVMVALTLIIACVVALSALAIRVEKVMTDQSRTLIAADLVFKSANRSQYSSGMKARISRSRSTTSLSATD